MSDFYVNEIKTEENPPLLANRSSLTEDGMKEALTAFMRTPSWILVRVLFAVMAGVGIFILIRGINLGMDTTNILSGGLVILLSAVMYFHRFVMYPAKKAKDVMKARKQKYKTDEITTEYFFYDDVITSVTQKTDTTDIGYDSIRRVFSTRNHIILSTFSRKMLILSPDGFDSGDQDDFYKLMEIQCPKALPKNRKSDKGGE